MNGNAGSVPRYSAIFVLGMSHSGSTLLGRMLDMHPRMLCVGELMRIKEAIKQGLPCSCGKLIPECEFWREYISLIEKENNFNYKRFTPEFYDKLRKASENEVMVDLSKNKPVRLINGFISSRNWKSSRAGFILLLRDPRGVAASLLRRRDRGLEKFLSRYVKWMKRFERFIRKRRDRVIVVRYEDLCLYPENEIKRICEFIGVDFEKGMSLPVDKTHHFIHSSTSGYMKNINKLKIDERWRHELGAGDIGRIEAVIEKLDLLKEAYSSGATGTPFPSNAAR